MSMKSESVIFYTQQSVEQLTNRLRQAVQAVKGEVSQLQDDGLNSTPEEERLAILISGHNFMGGQRMWGVQVFISDFQTSRSVELVALGDKLGSTIMNSYYGGGYLQFGDSKKRRDRIAAMLTDNDPSAVFDTGQELPPEQEPVPQAQPSAPEVHVVSDDGVDLQASSAYNMMNFLRSSVDKEAVTNMADGFFGESCRKFADENPDFPACSELKFLYASALPKDNENYYIYEPYLQLFPDSSEAVNRIVRELFTWNAANPGDVRALCLLAYTAITFEDLEKAREYLYRILLLEKQGTSLEGFVPDWGAMAVAADFEEWFVKKYGDGQVVQPAQPVQSAQVVKPVQPVQPVQAAPMTQPVQSKPSFAKGSVNLPSLGNGSMFHKAAIILAGAAVVTGVLGLL